MPAGVSRNVRSGSSVAGMSSAPSPSGSSAPRSLWRLRVVSLIHREDAAAGVFADVIDDLDEASFALGRPPSHDGYDATLVADAHTTDDPSQWGAPLDAAQVIAHTNLYWKYHSAPGRTGGVVPTAEVAF